MNPGPGGGRGAGRRGRERGPAPEVVYGVNPVLELLSARRREVERVLVARDRHAGVGPIVRLAREAGIPVSHLERSVLARRVGRAAAHQGIAAVVSPVAYANSADLCGRAAAERGMLILLDGVTDPGNLGAVIRTAAAAGAVGVLLSGEGTVGLTPVVAKAAAGALEHLPVAREASPPRRLRELREQGFQVVALDGRAETRWDQADLTGRLVLVAGGEGRGLRPGLQRECGIRAAIPLAPGVESLNVSVALGVVLYEAVRQRRGAKPGLETS